MNIFSYCPQLRHLRLGRRQSSVGSEEVATMPLFLLVIDFSLRLTQGS